MNEANRSWLRRSALPMHEHNSKTLSQTRFTMKHFRSNACAAALHVLAVGSLASSVAVAQAARPPAEVGPWQFTATFYGWVPTIDGRVNFPGDQGSTGIHASMNDVLSHLKMTFQGSLDVHNGRWGLFNDIVYVDFGGVKSQTHDFTLGNVGIPASATAEQTLDLKSSIWTVAGEYRLATDPAWTVDLLGGARMLRMKPTLGYSVIGDLGSVVIPVRNGSKQVDARAWDGILGVKARYTFGEGGKWFVPLYLDVGTGQSQLTWQISGGVGYSYSWGSVFAEWRYLDYNFQSGKALDSMSMSGPMLGVALRW